MDEGDLEYVKSGATDLVGCVLDSADLRNMDLRNRDFANSQIKKVDFSGSDLSGSNFYGASHAHSVFRGCNLSETKFDGSIFGLDFRSSDLTGATISGLLTKTNLSNSIVIGVDFTKARFREGCNLDEIIADQSTKFDGTQILRPYLKNPIFDGYTLKRGILSRNVDDRVPADTTSRNNDLAIAALVNGVQLLEEQKNRTVVGEGDSLIGHNRPPPEFVLPTDEFEKAIDTLNAARNSLVSGEQDQSLLKAAIETASSIGKKATEWIARQADIAATEFSKEFGKTLGSKTGALIATTYLSGAMGKIVELLVKLAN